MTRLAEDHRRRVDAVRCREERECSNRDLRRALMDAQRAPPDREAAPSEAERCPHGVRTRRPDLEC